MSTRPQAPWPARVRIRPLAIGSVALLLTLGLSSNRAMASPPSGAASRSNPSDARAGEPAGAADEAAGYDRATALRDLEIVVRETGPSFLAARERLGEAPEVTRLALTDMRARTDLDAAARARLDAVERSLPDTASLEDLREKLRNFAKLNLDIEDPLERITARGVDAAPHLLEVARDRELPIDVRATLLASAVGVSEQLDAYLPYVGGGDAKLQRALRRALVQRARSAPKLRERLVRALDPAGQDMEPASSAGSPAGDQGASTVSLTEPQRAARIALRAALGEIDDDLSERWVKTATSNQAPFEVRVAALRALEGDARAHEALATAVRTLLVDAVPPEGPSGRSTLPTEREVLGALALAALSGPTAAALVDELGLTGAAAPRVAATAWRVATLAPDPGLEWLQRSQGHAWPQVRVAALNRVAGGCNRVGAKRLADIAGRDERAADPEPQVARAALRALGRCRTPAAESALRGVIADVGIRVELRGDAALALVGSSPDGVTSVAKALMAADDEALSEVLLDALTAAEQVPTTAAEAACVAASRSRRLAPRARRLAARATPGVTCDALSPSAD